MSSSINRVSQEKILIIKLSALGDVVLAFSSMTAIRAHHPDAEITLLTTSSYVDFALRSPWVDAVLGNGRPDWIDLVAVLELTHNLRRGGYKRVYDLQTSRRSSFYKRLMKPVEWSGIAMGCSHPHNNPARNAMHTVERQREQLALAGIRNFPDPDLSWLDADFSHLNTPESFAVFIPGSSHNRLAKRWPGYAELATLLPMPIVVVGGRDEGRLADAIVKVGSSVLDLTGKTTLFELATLMRKAALVVGNDTGPTHLAAALGCRTLALFGEASDPGICSPRGLNVRMIQSQPLATLRATEVLDVLGEWLA